MIQTRSIAAVGANRWQTPCGRQCRGAPRGATPREDEGLIGALSTIMADETPEPAFVALMLTMPSEADIARDIGRDVDPGRHLRGHARACARRWFAAWPGAARDLSANPG